jgi:hypothetical protein
MKNSELLAKLKRLDELKQLIETTVKDTYKEHGELTIELTEELLTRKAGDNVGILRAPIQIKFKDGQAWELRPNYMKDGQLKNVIWKPNGVDAFSINHLLSE